MFKEIVLEGVLADRGMSSFADRHWREGCRRYLPLHHCAQLARLSGARRCQEKGAEKPGCCSSTEPPRMKMSGRPAKSGSPFFFWRVLSSHSAADLGGKFGVLLAHGIPFSSFLLHRRIRAAFLTVAPLKLIDLIGRCRPYSLGALPPNGVRLLFLFQRLIYLFGQLGRERHSIKSRLADRHISAVQLLRQNTVAPRFPPPYRVPLPPPNAA